MNVRLTETLLRPLETGFQVKYTGPDTDGELMELPITKLFRMSTDSTLDDNIKASGSAIEFLEHYFTSSLRDIRRTYQRAFKGLLFALRFQLSAETPRPGLQSELSVFLQAPENFIGTCYYRIAPSEFSTHHAFFDLNFLPVTDFYTLPNLQCDSRVEPSLKREAALFDWWERIFDYCDLRNSLHEQPVWMLFYDAAVQQPRVPDPLLRYLDVDIGLARQVFSYYDSPTTKFTVQTSMLSDERWAIRVRHAGNWMKELNKRFYTKSAAHNTLPYLWVSDDPNVVLGDTSGNANMTRFFHESFDRGNDKQIKQINDGLRQRARTTLLAYL
jgi:hypothetical protein